jgi:hypothetical protein
MKVRSCGVMVLLVCGSLANVAPLSAEVLRGDKGESETWNSAWFNLDKPRDFHKGDRLRLEIPGKAAKVLVRLLVKGTDPNDPSGIIGGAIAVPENRVIDVIVDADYANVSQISVHGGPNPWNNDLGADNAAAKLGSVELVDPTKAGGGTSPAFTYERLQGQIGASPKWGSGWLDLAKTRDFSEGDRLRIQVGGAAKKVLVRVLRKGAEANTSEGVMGGIIEVPADRVIEVPIAATCKDVIQVSVHGGPRPWDQYDLGADNGAATLSTCDYGTRR